MPTTVWGHMKRNNLTSLFWGVIAVLVFSVSVRASDESEVREMVSKVFQQLKSHDYGSVYDGLPNSSRSRMSRDRIL
jgi:hypothetical protein